MKTFAVACLLGATSAFSAMQSADYEFIRYVAKYGKTYGTKEEFEFRAALFKTNLAEVEALNSMNSTSTHGINKFSDMTKDEKKRFLSGFVATPVDAPVAKFTAPLKESVNWVTGGAVTGVKNQGQCGSCWAFSTTGSIEGAEFIANGNLTSVSEQQLVDCATRVNKGCNGGSMPMAFIYAKQNGLMTETDYPYTAVDGTCAYDKSKTVTHVTGHESVTAGSETAMRSAIAQQPVSIAIEADETAFQSYTSGILSSGCGQQLDHGVLAVGYGTEEGVNYILVKNSWGGDWGLSGYLKIASDESSNVCGILNQGSFPNVSTTA